MKRSIALLVLFTIFANNRIQAQEESAPQDTTWKTGGVASLNLTQAYYENWTAGGVPSVAGVAFFKAFAKYEKNKWRWDNQLDLGYGLISERERLMRKTDDKFNFDTKLGYNMKGFWYASLLATFKSQFTAGYEDPELQQVKISDYMAPAYIMTSLGFDYNPNDNFGVFIAPAAIKTTLVLDQDLADKGAFGVEGGEWTYTNENGIPIDSSYTSGKNRRTEMGAQLKLLVKGPIMTNVAYLTRLELYANYFDNVGNIDVNWEGLIDMKINDYLSANIRLELIYDDDIEIYTGTDDDGVEHFGPRMQIKQLFGLGVSFKF